MKRCPECLRDYTDETLNFCLDDGTRLVDGPVSMDEAQTAMMPPPEAEPTTRTIEPGLRETRRTGTGAAVASNRNSLIVWGMGVIVVSALVFGTYVYYGGGTGKQIDSIAVLPFANESGNPELEYLSDGITETLIGRLSQLPNLNVKARSSVFRYKAKEADPHTIGHDLGVQAVLIGRLTQRGEELTLRLELIDVQTENVIWADYYDRKASDLVSLQNEIARDVSGALRARLSRKDKQRIDSQLTANAEAYRRYLLGRFEWNKRQKDSLLRAADHFKNAIELDPNFAFAYAGLADCYIVFSTYELAPPSEAYALARAAVQKALELDETHGEAYATLASINDDYDWDFAAAERNYLKAIELSPNYATARQAYAEYLRMMGRFDEATVQASRAVYLDPVSLPVNLGLAETFCLAGRFQEAIPQFQRTIELDPRFAPAFSELARCYDMMGNHDQAVVEGQKAAEMSGGSSSSLAKLGYSLGRSGKLSEARGIITRLEQRRKETFVDGVHLAQVYYAVGDIDAAFAQFERAVQERSPAVRYIKVDSRFGDELRVDPRYSEIVKKIGLP